MFALSSRGSFKKTLNFLDKLKNQEMWNDLDRYGQMGVDALSRATPRETGLTANSWDYEVIRGRHESGIAWLNRNINDGANVAILLQYGHGTGTGGFVQGEDYINPSIKPVFDTISDEIWRRITTA